MESQPQNPEFRNNPANFHPKNLWVVPIINLLFRESLQLNVQECLLQEYLDVGRY